MSELSGDIDNIMKTFHDNPNPEKLKLMLQMWMAGLSRTSFPPKEETEIWFIMAHEKCEINNSEVNKMRRKQSKIKYQIDHGELKEMNEKHLNVMTYMIGATGNTAYFYKIWDMGRNHPKWTVRRKARNLYDHYSTLITYLEPFSSPNCFSPFKIFSIFN